MFPVAAISIAATDIGWAMAAVGAVWLLYAYAIYPIAIAFAARTRPAPIWARGALPRVALIISAYNEEEIIAKKIENALSLNYPPELLKIVVSSDGSTDGTVAAAQRVAACVDNVRVVAHAANAGKTAALMATLRGLTDVDVVVFSDANSMYQDDALSKLLAPFCDPRVGAVAGELLYEDASAEGLYRRYENALKRNESRLAGCLTAEGSIFAARRELVPELRFDEIEDVAIPLAIGIGGKKVVYEPRAISRERFGLPSKAQYVRRRRIVSRALKTTWRYRAILNPLRSGPLSIMFFSHRIMRWFSPFAALLVPAGAAVVTVSLLPVGVALWAVPAGALLGIVVPYLLRGHGRLGIPWAIFVALAAITAGVVAACRGRSVVTWAPARPGQIGS